MAAALKLKPNATSRVLRGHPWVFANEVVELLPAEHDGGVVECRDARGRFLGTGIYNSRSQIVWRRLSRERVELDEAYLRAALARAIGRREPAGGRRSPSPGQPVAQRLVWSESDDLPGVVVDQFGDTLVLQTQTLAMEKRLETLVALLEALVKPAEIILRNDAPIRRLEGLPLEVATRSGQPGSRAGCASTDSSTGSTCRADRRPAFIWTSGGSTRCGRLRPPVSRPAGGGAGARRVLQPGPVRPALRQGRRHRGARTRQRRRKPSRRRAATPSATACAPSSSWRTSSTISPNAATRRGT